jgi:two-component system sensor kinase FixL
LKERSGIGVAIGLGLNEIDIRLADTGTGISSPYELFKPFQRGANAAGLGLYVSRAILRSSGGDLRFEPRKEGCCFAVSLTRARYKEDGADE